MEKRKWAFLQKNGNMHSYETSFPMQNRNKLSNIKTEIGFPVKTSFLMQKYKHVFLRKNKTGFRTKDGFPMESWKQAFLQKNILLWNNGNMLYYEDKLSYEKVETSFLLKNGDRHS